ncbi:hypothetical protein NKH74_27715 [Mesorhizobium sp. M0933]|uniref:hypothetical protein n=1 Tax=Mesorhizobium sp. M0933 TaxID=2957030 RepID=UPI00333B0333
MMTENFSRSDFSDLPPEDKMGFAAPVTPAHSLRLLNNYMRTDLLRHIHLHVHQMKDGNEPGSPLHYLAKSLERVVRAYDGLNLFECVTRNPFHIDPDYEFDPEQDYLHDLKLMRHHLKFHKRTIRDLGRYR